MHLFIMYLGWIGFNIFEIHEFIIQFNYTLPSTMVKVNCNSMHE